MRPTFALPLLLSACAPHDGGFVGGGTPRDETWLGSEDTASPLLDDADLARCMDLGGVRDIGGDAPPDVEGDYEVAGHLVASDSAVPEGTATGGRLCLYDQDGAGGIALRERAAGASTWTLRAWIRGEGDRFTLWLELEGDDSLDADCRVRALGVVSGEQDGEDLRLRTATVPVAYEGCEDYDASSLGGCWATEAEATRDGDCGG